MGKYVESRSEEEIGRKRRKGQIFIGTLESATCINIISDIEGNCIQQRHRSSSSVVPPVTIPLGLQ
jgi:hypothetical protein